MPKPERAGDRGEGKPAWTGRDRPIIMSAPMVRAILREIAEPGTGKTQTRRIIKPRGRVSLFDGTWSDAYVLDPGNESWRAQEMPAAVGDRLWVKEEARRSPDVWTFTADGEPVAWPGRGDLAGRKRDICTSLFLPRSCSRLTLIVEAVKVERLADITDADARAEGFEAFGPDIACPYQDGPTGDAADAFAAYWDSLHGKGAFEVSPWVAALTFRVIPQNIDSLDPTPVCDTPTDQAAPPTPEQSR